MRTVYWKLNAGRHENPEQKRKEGLAYIEKLGDEVVEVIKEQTQFKIILKDEEKIEKDV